jgi:hypothetical protein
MCGGDSNPGAAQAAEQTRLTEAQQAWHDAAVSEGKSKIDQAFSAFDDPYYAKFAQTYKDTYNPQLDEQYGIAKDKLTSIMAGRDTLDSTAGANAIAQQSKTYNNTQADIANKATDASNNLRPPSTAPRASSTPRTRAWPIR